MLSGTYYAKSYAGIISRGLRSMHSYERLIDGAPNTLIMIFCSAVQLNLWWDFLAIVYCDS